MRIKMVDYLVLNVRNVSDKFNSTQNIRDVYLCSYKSLLAIVDTSFNVEARDLILTVTNVSLIAR